MITAHTKDSLQLYMVTCGGKLSWSAGWVDAWMPGRSAHRRTAVLDGWAEPARKYAR